MNVCDFCAGKIDHAALGAELRALRLSRGISVKAMAITLEINASYLSQLEHGKRPHWSAARREAYLKYCEEAR